MLVLAKMLMCFTLAQGAQAEAWLSPSAPHWAIEAAEQPLDAAPESTAETPESGSLGGEVESEVEPALHSINRLVPMLSQPRLWAADGVRATPEGYRPGPHRPPSQR